MWWHIRDMYVHSRSYTINTWVVTDYTGTYATVCVHNWLHYIYCSNLCPEMTVCTCVKRLDCIGLYPLPFCCWPHLQSLPIHPHSLKCTFTSTSQSTQPTSVLSSCNCTLPVTQDIHKHISAFCIACQTLPKVGEDYDWIRRLSNLLLT